MLSVGFEPTISAGERPQNYTLDREATGTGKGKAIPLQAWRGPKVSRRLRLPDFKKSAYEGGKVVSPTHRPPLPPGNIPGTHFC